MVYHPGPTRSSTSAERAVIVWVVVLIMLGLGAVLLYLGFTAPPAKATEAAQAIRSGWITLGLAFAIATLRVLVLRLTR